MKWRTDNPPAVGWYEASTQSPPLAGVYRWWNGHWWSSCAEARDNAEEAAQSAAVPLHAVYFNHPTVKWREIKL